MFIPSRDLECVHEISFDEGMVYFTLNNEVTDWLAKYNILHYFKFHKFSSPSISSGDLAYVVNFSSNIIGMEIPDKKSATFFRLRWGFGYPEITKWARTQRSVPKNIPRIPSETFASFKESMYDYFRKLPPNPPQYRRIDVSV